MRYNFSAVMSCDQCVKMFPSSYQVAGVNMFQMRFGPSTGAKLDILHIKQYIYVFWGGDYFNII